MLIVAPADFIGMFDGNVCKGWARRLCHCTDKAVLWHRERRTANDLRMQNRYWAVANVRGDKFHLAPPHSVPPDIHVGGGRHQKTCNAANQRHRDISRDKLVSHIIAKSRGRTKRAVATPKVNVILWFTVLYA